MNKLEPTDIIKNDIEVLTASGIQKVGQTAVIGVPRLREILQDLLETEDLGLVQTKEIQERFGLLFR